MVKDLAKKSKSLRSLEKATQRILADFIGCDKSLISKYENGYTPKRKNTYADKVDLLYKFFCKN